MGNALFFNFNLVAKIVSAQLDIYTKTLENVIRIRDNGNLKNCFFITLNECEEV